MSHRAGLVELREIHVDDLDVFFRIQNDTESNELAKVYPRDRLDFDVHWDKIINDAKIIARSIVSNGIAVGQINSFPIDEEIYVGYWLDRESWGLGIATRSLRMFLEVECTRPLYASVSVHNKGSCRVLERCGFVRLEESNSPGNERYAPCRVARYRLNGA